MKKPIKKTLVTIPIEDAHSGAGKRQLILSNTDDVTPNLQAFTKGFLEPGGIFAWHNHEGIDEFFVVLKGSGIIRYESGEVFDYTTDDIFNSPSGLKHQIENTGSIDSEFFFVRVFCPSN